MKKTPSASKVEMTELVLPNHTNLIGNLLGGKLMNWIDICGAMSASRHSNSVVATVSLDSLDFKKPIKVGEMVKLNAKIIWAGNTSMEAVVKVYAENFLTGNIVLTNEARLVYVALNEDGKPSPVPKLLIETDEEGKLFDEVQKRRKPNRKKKSN